MSSIYYRQFQNSTLELINIKIFCFNRQTGTSFEEDKGSGGDRSELGGDWWQWQAALMASTFSC